MFNLLNVLKNVTSQVKNLWSLFLQDICKKVSFRLKILAEKFGFWRKMLYLCSRENEMQKAIN